jgi:peptidoglycan/LPS O-acetylase OafA/YrhL
MTRKISSERFTQLDALRAFAVLVVMIHHYRKTDFFLSGFGATLFFVLSGFFVTRTLLKLKNGITAGRLNITGALKTFYVKRWLRLWPLYYLVLALTLLLNVEHARSSILWNVAFLSNLQVLLTGNWNGRFSPLWSLSVLEQFYLVWPALVLLCPRQRMFSLVLCTIAMGPLYRLLCLVSDASPLYWCVVPFASFDQLGCGALLALCMEPDASKISRERIQWFAGAVCVPVFLVLLAGKSLKINPCGSAIYIGLIASFSFVWLVNRIVAGFTGWPKTVFESPLLCHMGRMSYSIFLLHNFTELLVPKYNFLRPVLESNYKAVLLIPLTLLLAHLSWCIVESPILSLRRKYSSAAPGHVAGEAVAASMAG